MEKISRLINRESWIVGLTDADGCFYISINTQKGRTKVGQEYKITQHEKNREILEEISKYQNCGYIKDTKSNVVRYVTRDINSITEIQIPIFDKNSLLTTKGVSYSIWKDLIKMKQNKHYKTDLGQKEMRKLQENLNSTPLPKE